MDNTEQKHQLCPICYREFSTEEIEAHVDKCIFLNSTTQDDVSKRKRILSPTIDKSKPPTVKGPPQKLNSPSKKQKTATVSLKNFFQQKSKDDMIEEGTSMAVVPEVNSSNKSLQMLVNLLENPTDLTDDANTSLADSTQSASCVNSTDETSFHTGDLSFAVPLANQVQPKSLNEFFGQNHVLGKQSVLRSLLERGEVPNMILWGPPGCGKTSLSRVVQEMCKANPKKKRFVSLCAATSGVKDVQKVIAIGKSELIYGRKTILFMDEIHRFNKSQQDTFLLHVEKGNIILMGATTENPSFSINSALLSRCRVIVLEKLDVADLVSILERAARSLCIDLVDVAENPFVTPNNNRLSIDTAALAWLANISDGDARIALGNLELVLQHHSECNKLITTEDIKEGIKKCHMLYDRKGEEHYNIISAMHKSIRGSDVNAALYWTTRMIVSGEDPLFIARRLVRAASEDIGNADPNALQLAVSTMQGCKLLGMPEADVLLAQCAIYLARAPKSREADSALAKAKNTISKCQGVQPPVPLHLRNAPTKLMRDLGYGKRAAGSRMTFMPPNLENVDFFK